MIGQFQRSESLKEKRRSAKPANLDAAQDWYWIEEFPRGSGIEPGTGNMSTWFHGGSLFDFVFFFFFFFFLTFPRHLPRFHLFAVGFIRLSVGVLPKLLLKNTCLVDWFC